MSCLSVVDFIMECSGQYCDSLGLSFSLWIHLLDFGINVQKYCSVISDLTHLCTLRFHSMKCPLDLIIAGHYHLLP